MAGMTAEMLTDADLAWGHPYHSTPRARYDGFPMETTPCPRCGKANDADAAFCRRCGVTLIVPNSAAATAAAPTPAPEVSAFPSPQLRPVTFPEPPPSSSLARFGLVAGLFVAGLGIALMIFVFSARSYTRRGNV